MAFQTIGLIGPPNVGKSTLFNRLTGLRQKVSNYSGVTVEHRSGRLRGTGQTVVDLPGVWTLTPNSDDQRIAVSILKGQQPNLPKLDAVLLVVDGTQFHKYSMLIGEVLDCKLPTMLLINMADELEKRKGFIDPLAIAREVGTPTALISAANGTGMDSIQKWVNQDQTAGNLLNVLQKGGNAASCAPNCNTLTAAGAYRRPQHSAFTRGFDRWALHPVAGPILCLVFLLAAFQVIFRFAYPAGQWLSNTLGDLGTRAGSLLPDNVFRALLVDGVWNGVASILGFLPQILCLFLVITVLEDTGYMARAAVIADRTMGRVGLNGRSFLPLLSAYACAVPAIMATRAIPSKRDRLATILIAPFMTCSARLPVYALLIAAFIPSTKILGNLLGLQAATMMLLYLVGLLAALFTAFLLRSSVMKGQASMFAIELPNYRMPRLRTIGIAMVDRSKVFLKQVATVILVLESGDLVPGASAAEPRPCRRRWQQLSGAGGWMDRAGASSVGPEQDRRHCAIDGLRRAGKRRLHTLDALQFRPSRRRAARRHRSERRTGSARILRAGDAVHRDAGCRPPRNRQLEVARPAVHLHDGAGLCRSLRDISCGTGDAPVVNRCVLSPGRHRQLLRTCTNPAQRSSLHFCGQLRKALGLLQALRGPLRVLPVGVAVDLWRPFIVLLCTLQRRGGCSREGVHRKS